MKIFILRGQPGLCTSHILILIGLLGGMRYYFHSLPRDKAGSQTLPKTSSTDTYGVRTTPRLPTSHLWLGTPGAQGGGGGGVACRR